MTALIKAAGRFTEADIDHEIVIMRLDNGEFFSLSGTAAAIWRLIDGERDTAALVADHHDRREGKTPAALHHLRNAVDGDQLVLQFVFLVAVAIAAIARATAGTTG